NPEGTYAAHYTIESDSKDIFTDEGNGTVTFADGQAETVIKVKASNMQKGTSYTAKINLSKEDVAQTDTVLGAKTSYAFTIACDYDWEEAGEAVFTDYTFNEAGAQSTVKMEHAAGSNIYRIVAPYSVYDAAGTDIQFMLNDAFEASMEDGEYALETSSVIGYSMVYNTAKYASYCKIASKGNLYTFEFLLTNGTSLYPGGQFTLEWTEGWPGK
ncbi:MAG TPA: hypothetical protein VIQ97_00375, partial [Prevotella sp.]